MRRALLTCALALAGVAVTLTALPVPAASAATHECDGLMVCVPVAGPWVVVPVLGAPRPRVEYQLSCPRGFIVGGLDAELSDREIDVSFAGRLGSPVNPGITTSQAVVVSATYVGAGAATASVRPHLGCIPASGGGGRVPTSVAAVFPPGQPAERRVRTVRVRAGASTVTQACRRDERLIAAAHAVAFFTATPPGAPLAGGVRAIRSLHGSAVELRVRATARSAAAHGVVQVAAVCAGGR